MPALSTQFNFLIKDSTSTTTATTSVAIPSAYIAMDNSTLFKSLPEKGDGFFGSADGVHTVTYTVTPSFAGTLTMQATLATSPIEADWFDVIETSHSLPIEYAEPITPATTTTNYVNFVGNFVWVRAIVHRAESILLPGPNFGSVLWVNYNH